MEYRLEVGRKGIHFLGSIGIALFVFYVERFEAFTALFGAFAVMYSINKIHGKGGKVPLFGHLVDSFERGNGNNPAKGAIDFFLGFSIITLLFPKEIAVVTILIVGFGDTFSTLVGRPMGGKFFRRISHKSIEGSIAFFLTAMIPALLLLRPGVALSACFMATITELVFHEQVDDNISVSFATAGILYIVLYVI